MHWSCIGASSAAKVISEADVFGPGVLPGAEHRHLAPLSGEIPLT
jgi:hypothetical protein